MKVIELQKKEKHSKPKAEVDEIIRKMRKEDEKLVKGQFEFTEAEGGFFKFSYRIYPGDSIQTFELIHGEICTIPIGLVKHLNGCKKKIARYSGIEQAQTGAIKPPRQYETISRVRFVPYEFLEKKAV